MTVSEAFNQAVREDMRLYAHAIFIAVTKGYITMDESIDNFDAMLLDEKEVLAAVENNVLAMHPIKIYAVPVDNFFSYYLAKNVDEVKQIHYENFAKIAVKIFDVSTKMHTDLFDVSTKKVESIAEIRQKTKVFPALICIVPMKG